jgi:DNA polymerase (family 10)
MLERIADLLSIKGDSQFRVRAYQDAASHIRSMSENVAELGRDGRLTTIPGVGPSIASKLQDWLQHGRSAYLDELARQVPAGVERLLDVPGVGPVRAHQLATKLGVTSPEELAAAAREHRLREIPGFGPRLEEKIAVEAQRWTQRERRLLLGTAWPVARRLVEALQTHPAIRLVSVAGSLRRMRETVGDLDLLAAADDTAAATDAFVHLAEVKEVLAVGTTKATILLHDGLQVDLRVVEPGSWGAALQHFTGSKPHNISLRERAIERGLRLNEYGVFIDRTGRRLGGEIEGDVYRAVGLDWMAPELREDRGEIQAAAEHRLPILVERSDILGDLHVHSNWSDGTASILAMATAARDAGLRYIAITDHTPGLTVAHGLSIERLRQQRSEIAAANEALRPFKVIQGAEVDIRPDGTLDLPDEVLAELDYVSVSVHTHFRMPRDAMTERIVRAIRHPRVCTLNHPTGRLLNRRPGYDVDLNEVLRVAATLGVSIEINSQPDRLDLDDMWARCAKELGCRLIVNSDGHGTAAFDNLIYGVAVARRGWLTSDDVLNTRPLAELLKSIRHPRRRVA